MNKDTFTLGGKEFSSRFILGSGKKGETGRAGAFRA